MLGRHRRNSGVIIWYIKSHRAGDSQADHAGFRFAGGLSNSPRYAHLCGEYAAKFRQQRIVIGHRLQQANSVSDIDERPEL
jgi:hypothetical protein